MGPDLSVEYSGFSSRVIHKKHILNKLQNIFEYRFVKASYANKRPQNHTVVSEKFNPLFQKWLTLLQKLPYNFR